MKDRKEPSKAQSPLCVPLLKMAKHLFTNHLLLHIQENRLPALSSPRPLLRFLLSSRCCPFVPWSHILTEPRVHICNKFGCFLPLICLMSIWSLDQPEELRGKGTNAPLPNTVLCREFLNMSPLNSEFQDWLQLAHISNLVWSFTTLWTQQSWSSQNHPK